MGKISKPMGPSLIKDKSRSNKGLGAKYSADKKTTQKPKYKEQCFILNTSTQESIVHTMGVEVTLFIERDG